MIPDDIRIAELFRKYVTQLQELEDNALDECKRVITECLVARDYRDLQIYAEHNPEAFYKVLQTLEDKEYSLLLEIGKTQTGFNSWRTVTRNNVDRVIRDE